MLFRFVFSLACSWTLLTSAEYSCNEGWTKCSSRDECYPKECDSEDGSEVERPTCGPGQVYCMATEACVPVCPNLGSDSQTETQCSGELIFCLSLGRCTPPNSCVQEQFGRDKKCPSGTQFCLSVGGCLQTDECGPPVGETSCPYGQVFCMSYGRCVHPSYCNEIETRKSCPSGFIFCMDKGRCMRSSECNTVRSGSITCKKGTVFCANLGVCSKDCSTDLGMFEFSEGFCPQIKGEFQYSNCVSSEHCPPNYICCTDSRTLHLQCINPFGESRNNRNNILESSCSALNTLQEDTRTGIHCDRPEDCMSESLCCDRVCLTPRGTKSCPLRTFFSSIKSRCEKVGSDSTHSCPPLQVFCPSHDGCMKYSECEFASESEIAWMMPKIVYIEKEGKSIETDGVPISSLYEGGSEDAEFIVEEVPEDPYAFECRESKSESLRWKPITPATELKSSFYIRFTITSTKYEFAVPYLNLTEKDSSVGRFISQVVAIKSSKFNLNVRNPLLVTIEDQVQLVAFHEVISIGESNLDSYWSAWEKAIGMPTKYLEMGLLDPSKSTTVELVEILTSPDLDIQGFLNIEYLQPEQEPTYRAPLSLEVSQNEGKSWKSLSLGMSLNITVKSTEDMSNLLLKFTPQSNRWGNASFIFRYVDVNSSSSDDNDGDGSNILTIQVLKINDAPTAMMLQDLTQIPVLTPQKPEIVISANELASLFYVDRDEDTMGVAIIYAQISMYGSWMYSLDNGGSWTEISDLNEFPLSESAANSHSKYQGTLFAMRESSKSSNLQESPDGGAGSNERKPNIIPFSKTKSQSIYSVFQSNVNVSASTDKVNLLFLSASVLIKYKVKEKTPWDIMKAINFTRLLITAWDGTDSESKEGAFTSRKEISLSKCNECGGFGSLAFSPTLVVAQWSGCNGETIITESSTVRADECGVCGGDGSTCKDCKGVVNGTAMKICGKCVDDEAEDPRDCAGECNNANSIETVDRNEICLLKGDNIPVCDKPCVKCKDNSTETIEQEGMDECGVCEGSNSCQGCDDKQWSSKKPDFCGNCLEPSSNEFNEGCEGIGGFLPLFIDFADIKSLRLPESSETSVEDIPVTPGIESVTISGKTVGKLEVKDCSFIKEESTQVNAALLVMQSSNNLKIIPPKLESGMWSVECELKSTSQSSITSNEKISVVDSSSIEIQSLSASEVDLNVDSEITLTLKNAVDLSNSFCFLKYTQPESDTDYYELLPTTDLPDDEDLLICHLDSSLRPGEAEIGVVLKASTLNFLARDELTLSTQRLRLKGLIPRVTEASFDNINKLSIKFNVNIDVPNNCIGNFKSFSSIFGEGATCIVKLNCIEITLGENFNLEEEIHFSDSNQIMQKYGDPESSPKAEGPIILTNDTTKESIEFEVKGPSKVCNGSNAVRATVTLKDDLDPTKFQVSWNITWQNKNDEKSQREVLLIWNSTRDIQNIFDNEKNIETVEFPVTLLRPGVVYLIVATLEGPNNFVSVPRSFTVESISSEENLLIRIRGQQKIYPQKTYFYSAEIELCISNQPPNSKYMYFWSLDSAENKFDSLYLKHRTLKPWSLKGGEKRTISVAVTSSDQAYIGYGTLEIEAIKQGIEVKVFPEGVKSGTANSIMLDASQSTSLDDPNTKLFFTWTCRRAEGGGCYVIENKKPKRFENAISKEDLNKPILNIPPLLLLQDKYVMKVTVRNRHGDSATAMVNVEIVSGYLPYLSLNMTSQLVDITQPIFIEGWISSHTNAEIFWKSVDDAGFGRVEIPPSVSDAFRISAVRGPVENFPVPLTIPTTAKWGNVNKEESDLKANTRFKLRLSAFTAGQEDSYADIVITKKSPPVPGKIEVNPSQGEGLMTSFVFSATGWRDIPMDLPFTASFGYVFSSSADVEFSRAVWFGKAYGDELSSTTFLPSVSSYQTKILPVVRVCDNTMACTFLKGESAVTVTPPTDISMEKIRELGSILESKLEDNSLVEGAIREVTMVMKTLKAIGDEEKIKLMMDIIENQMMIKTQELKVSLQRNAEAASASLGMLYSSTFLNDVHYLQRENYDQLGSLQGHFMAYIRNEVPPEEEEEDFVYPKMDTTKPAAPKDPVYYPNTDDDLDAARKTNSPSNSINVNVGGGDILSASVGGDNVLSANVGDGDILSASVGGDELLNANVGGGVLSASVGGDDLLSVNGDGGGLLNINLGIGKKRRKRQSESTEEVKPMTAEEVFKLVNFTEMQIKNSTDEEQVNHMTQLVQDISTYISSLCLSLQISDEPAVVYGQNVSIRVLKPLLEGKDVTNFVVADAESTEGDFVVKSSYLTWGPVLKSYIEWDCGKMDVDGKRVNCYGACLATVEYGDIYNSPVDTTSLPGVSRGHMIRAALLNPEKGTEIALKDITTKMAFNISAESVKAQKLETSKETNLQCFGWTDNRWSQKACVNGQHKTGETSNYMTCECNQTTYVKIFSVNKTEEPITEIPENTTDKILVDDVTDSTVIMTEISDETTQTEPTEVKDQTEMTWRETKRYISARFDGNFTEVVGKNNEREEEAKEWMTEAIARRINVSSSRMKNINITEGSVDYEAYLVDDESVMRSSNENSADEASAVLAQLIAENFVIEGPNGERLTAISDPPSSKEKESFLPILIGGIVGGVLLICFVFVVLAIYYHTKKKKDKVTALDGNLPPSYRAIQFDKSFDGNDPSGLKRRSIYSRGSKRGMTPDSAKYVNEDGKDDLIIQRSLKSGSGSHADSGFGNDEDVPDAFQYKTPTKEQLDRTGPIPEHVLRQVNSRNQDIPGTPQDS